MMMGVMHSHSSTFYAGTSGLVLPVANKSFFPIAFQDKPRLSYYASLFNSVEINSSFYKIPLAKTVMKWATETPQDFQFTFKLWQGITHNKGLLFNEKDIAHFMGVIANADNKSGCLLIQLPPSTTIAAINQLDKLLRITQQINNGQWHIAVEFRHTSWYQQQTYNLLVNQNATLVLHDMPSSGIATLPFETEVVYLRFHGVNGNYKGGYSHNLLQGYANHINTWRQTGKTVYAYFNNTIGSAVNDLIALNGLVELP